jgi:hypothetical protein
MTDVNGWILGLAKAAISLFFLGGLSFIGTWAVGMNSTVAGIRDDVQSLKEKEKMVTEMIYPSLIDQIKDLRGSIRELDAEIKQLNGRKR